MMFLSNRKSIFCFDRFYESVDGFKNWSGGVLGHVLPKDFFGSVPK